MAEERPLSLTESSALLSLTSKRWRKLAKASKFIHGLRLSELYYKQVVAPTLKKEFPKLRYSSGLIGTGSEVLGYDTPESMDHNWGLRLSIFLPDKELATKKTLIDRTLRRSLPRTFLGYPTSFKEPDNRGVRLPDLERKKREVNHYVDLLTISSFFKNTIGIDPLRKVDLHTWLVLPQQKLLEVTSGKLFRDDLGMQAVIERFSYYPRDIWLYMIASQWARISEEESFVARTSSVGDETGSKMIASRIVNEIMGLSFLMERNYAPYSKWFGSAFSRLRIASRLKPILTKILEADTIGEREKWLSRAYQLVATKHNSLNITRKRLSTGVSKYYQRPYLIIHASRFAQETRKRIRDKRLRGLPLIGSFDQLTSGSDLLTNQERLMQFRGLYEGFRG